LIPNKSIFLNYVQRILVKSNEIGKKNIFERYEILIEKLYDDETVNYEQLPFIIDELVSLHRKRKIQKFVVDLYEKIEFGEIDNAYGMVDKFQLKEYTTTDGCDSGEFSADYIKRIDDYIKKKKMKLLDYIPTGLVGYNPVKPYKSDKIGLDLFLQGGFYKGELILIIGDSNSGKSLTLMEFALGGVINNKNVFYATIEMSKEKQMMRLDSRVSGIQFNKFRSGKLKEHELVRWNNKISNFRFNDNYGKFFVYGFPKGCTVTSIDKKIRELQHKEKISIDMVVIDYLNDMKVSGQRNYVDDKDWKFQGEISWELKGIASQYNIPVITASQAKPGITNNKVIIDGKKIIFKSLKWDSSAFSKLPSYHATIIIGILASKFCDNGVADIINFQIIKARDSETTTGIVTFPDLSICKINTSDRMYRLACEKVESTSEFDDLEELE
jgi:replicative DNA helicase